MPSLHHFESVNLRRWLASTLVFLLLWITSSPIAQAETVISTSTTWTNPSTLSDSLRITSSGSLRILGPGSSNGGNLTVLLPNGGSFIVENGGLLDLSAQGGSGNGGILTVNLAGATGTINVAGIIHSKGKGAGTGGTITLNGSAFSLASTGQILATGGYLGKGGKVALVNPSGVITVGSGFSIKTNGITDGAGGKNLITLDGVGVNVSGILNAEGAGNNNGGRISIDGNGGGVTINNVALNANGGKTNGGGKGGTIDITSTGASNVQVNGQLLSVGQFGTNGGTITITAGNDLTVDGSAGARLIASSGSNGTNLGSGGTVTLTAGGDITVSTNNGSYVVNVNAPDGPSTTTGQAGTGGTVKLSANGDILLSSSASSAPRALIEANGAQGTSHGTGGTIDILKATNVTLQSTSTHKRLLIKASGGKGSGSYSGSGGIIRSRNVSGDFITSNVLAYANGGSTAQSYSGNAGTVDLQFAGDFNGTDTTILTEASGSGLAGTMKLISSGGDIFLNDTDSYFLNRTHGTGVVTVQGRNITNAGTIGSRATRTAGGAANDRNGGTINITATGILTNTGEISASAWTPRLDYIPTAAESTGKGGFVNITANSMVITGSSGLRKGNIYAYGGLNTQGSQQGQGGQVNMTITNALTMNSLAEIDTRGEPTFIGSTGGRNRIDITAGSMSIDGRINASGFYAEDRGGAVALTTTGGDLDITTNGLVSASGGIGDIFNNTGIGGEIDLDATGDINITGEVSAIGNAGYDGGNVTAIATGAINVSDNGLIDVSSSNGNRTGDGGTIQLNGATFNIAATSTIASNLVSRGNLNTTTGQGGNGGVINIATTGNIGLSSTANTTSTPLIDVRGGQSSVSGDGGTVSIVSTGGTILMQKTGSGTRLMASADTRSANGDSGSITVTANSTLTMDSANLSSRGSGGVGSDGGTITLNGNGMTLTDTELDVYGDDSWGGTLVLDGGTGVVDIDSASTFRSYGWSDATRNRITVRGGSLDIDAHFAAYGDNSTGSAGGAVTLESRTGNIATNGDIETTGYVRSASQTGSGGDITITSAGNYTLGSSGELETKSLRQANVNATDGGHGGDVNITTDGSITITRGISDPINTRGVYYNQSTSADLTGGDGGDVTLDSGTGVTLTGAGGNPTYIHARAGAGQNAGDGGDGGNVIIVTGSGSLSVSPASSLNYRLQYGAVLGTSTGTDGQAGTVTVDGVPQ